MLRIRTSPLVLYAAMLITLLWMLLNHQSSDPTLFGRYSVPFLLSVGAVALTGFGGAALVVWLARSPEDKFCRRLGPMARLRERWIVRFTAVIGVSAFMTVYWLRFPDILRDVNHPYLRFCLTIFLLGGVYFGLFWRANDPVIGWRGWLLIGMLAGAAGVALTLTYLTRLPMLDTLDELHNYIVQWTYARLGLLGDGVYRQMIPLPQPIYDSPHILVGLFLRLIGDQFWQARFARFLFSCLALPFIYNSGKILYGRRAGLYAVVIAFFYLAPTSFVRPDFAVGVMLSIGLYAYLKARQVHQPIIRLWTSKVSPNYSPLLHFLTGLLIGLGGEGHPLAYRFGLAFAVIYTARWINDMRVQRRVFIDGRIIALGIGGALAMLIYLSIHILPGLEQGLHFAKSYAPSARTSQEQAEAALGIVSRQVEVWLGTSPIEAWIAFVGVILAVWRVGRGGKAHGDRLILTILVVSEILMLATYGYYRAFYQVHFLPLFALLMGKALADGFSVTADPQPVTGRASQLILAGMVLCLSVAMLADTGASSRDPSRDEYESIGAQLAATLPPDAIVVANEDYFLEMRSLNFYGISTTTTDSWFLVKLQGYPLWEATHPDIFVITPELDTNKYVPMYSIYAYLQDYDFKLVRCYTRSGLYNAQVWVKTLPDGWSIDPDCQNWLEPSQAKSTLRAPSSALSIEPSNTPGPRHVPTDAQ